MSLEVNVRKWWECSGDELWATKFRRPRQCYRRWEPGKRDQRIDLVIDVTK